MAFKFIKITTLKKLQNVLFTNTYAVFRPLNRMPDFVSNTRPNICCTAGKLIRVSEEAFNFCTTSWKNQPTKTVRHHKNLTKTLC